MKRILLIIPIFLVALTCLGQQNIATGEYFIDTDPGPGNGTPVTVASPSTDLSLSLSVGTSGLQPGFHTLNYRFRDESGIWGLTSSRIFNLAATAVTPANLISGEYFIDSDPGVGNATTVNISSPSTDVTSSFQIPWSNLPVGMHTLNYRFLDENGRWSQVSGQLIYVEAQAPALPSIVYAEYFFDQDPGAGNGTSVTFTPGTNVTVPAVINLPPLTKGFHNLQVRFRDENGRWSETESQALYIQAGDSVPRIVHGEYFVDVDPGTGNGTKLDLSAPTRDISLNPQLKADAMTGNTVHFLNYRFQDENGNWGMTSGLPVFVDGPEVQYFTPINKVEYHVDTDTSAPKLRIDSVGTVMHGNNLSYSLEIQPIDNPGVGRHYVSVRGIDFFGQYSPDYNMMKFIVSDDTTKGMLLGISLSPDSTIMNSGSVQVYQDVAGQLTFYKSLSLDNTGNFLTTGLDPGSYLLLLKPDVAKYPTSIDTYFELEPQWERGTVLSINSDTKFNDVLIKALGTKSLGGTSSLSGFISQSSKKSLGISMSPGVTEGNPVKSASVILIGRNKGITKVYAKAVTDDNGYYVFSDVPAGAYDLLVDILGVPLVDHYSVDVKDSSSTIDNLNYLVGGAGIYIASVSPVVEQMKVLVYPNPSHGDLNILFSDEQGRVNIKVYDLAGRMVFASQLEAEPGIANPLDLHTLPPGIYTLEMSTQNKRETRKIILR